MNIRFRLDCLVKDGSDKGDLEEEFLSSLSNSQLCLVLICDMMELNAITSDAEAVARCRIDDKVCEWWEKRNAGKS